MITIARQLNSTGDYHRIDDGDFSRLPSSFFDLILSAFTFDNIPTMTKKIRLFKGLSKLLTQNGTIINLVSSPEIYTHEWTTFTTKNFSENAQAKSGDIVRIVTIDLKDKRPSFDIFLSENDYKKIYKNAELRIPDTYKPLATGKEPYRWINETNIAPCTIYVLKKKTYSFFFFLSITYLHLL